MSKEPRVTSDLSREDKIKRIYKVIAQEVIYTYYLFGEEIKEKEKKEYKSVMIWDVLDWMENVEPWTYDDFNESPWSEIYFVLCNWVNKRWPMENEEKVIDYVYSLIK